MTWYTYKSAVAVDQTGEVLRSGSGQVYAANDTDGTLELTPYDLSGLPLTEILIDGNGLTQAFRLEDAPECLWRSGDFAVPLDSPQGMREATEEALSSTLTLNQEVQDYLAANPSALPEGGEPGQIIGMTGSGVGWIDPPTSTSGIAGAPSVWPVTFAPSPHSHTIAEILKAAPGTPLATAVTALLNATDQQSARAAIGAGTGNGTSNLTLGSAANQAMPGNRIFAANEVSVTPITGLTLASPTVQAALQELRNQIASGGGGQVTGTGDTLNVTYSSGAYPAQAATPPAGIKFRHFWGPQQYTGPAWTGVIDLYDYLPLT